MKHKYWLLALMLVLPVTLANLRIDCIPLDPAAGSTVNCGVVTDASLTVSGVSFTIDPPGTDWDVTILQPHTNLAGAITNVNPSWSDSGTLVYSTATSATIPANGVIVTATFTASSSRGQVVLAPNSPPPPTQLSILDQNLVELKSSLTITPATIVSPASGCTSNADCNTAAKETCSSGVCLYTGFCGVGDPGCISGETCDTTEVLTPLCKPCNNNRICEPASGEATAHCPADCSAVPPPSSCTSSTLSTCADATACATASGSWIKVGKSGMVDNFKCKKVVGLGLKIEQVITQDGVDVNDDGTNEDTSTVLKKLARIAALLRSIFS